MFELKLRFGTGEDKGTRLWKIKMMRWWGVGMKGRIESDRVRQEERNVISRH